MSCMLMFFPSFDTIPDLSSCIGLPLHKGIGVQHAAVQKTAPPKSEETVAREEGSDYPTLLAQSNEDMMQVVQSAVAKG
jgi:hypothetical protein